MFLENTAEIGGIIKAFSRKRGKIKLIGQIILNKVTDLLPYQKLIRIGNRQLCAPKHMRQKDSQIMLGYRIPSGLLFFVFTKHRKQNGFDVIPFFSQKGDPSAVAFSAKLVKGGKGEQGKGVLRCDDGVAEQFRREANVDIGEAALRLKRMGATVIQKSDVSAFHVIGDAVHGLGYFSGYDINDLYKVMRVYALGCLQISSEKQMYMLSLLDQFFDLIDLHARVLRFKGCSFIILGTEGIVKQKKRG